MLKRLSGHADLSGTASYAVTQQWSLAVYRNPLNFDGFVYMSRHLNTERAVILFKSSRICFSVSVFPDFRLPLSFGCEIEAKLHIREPAHATPHDSVSWW